MGSSALIDTNLLIDFLAGVPQAHKELAKYEDRAISIVSRIELLVGMRPEGHDRAEDFLSRFQLIGLTSAIADEAVKIRQSTRLKLPDAILLATAQVEGRLFLTRNTRDFSASKVVRIPYKL